MTWMGSLCVRGQSRMSRIRPSVVATHASYGVPGYRYIVCLDTDRESRRQLRLVNAVPGVVSFLDRTPLR